MNDDLVSAYAFHKRQRYARASVALERARADVAAGKWRYMTMRESVAANDRHPGATNPDDGSRWFPDPSACGFRERGDAHDIAPRAIEHTGWFTDAYCDGLAVGVVFLLPGRDGHALAYPGIRFSDDDGVTIYLRDGERIESRHGEVDDGDFRDIACRADRLAEIEAEKRRDYDRAWQAGSLWRETRDEAKELCKTLRAVRVALRDLPAGHDVVREAAMNDMRADRRELTRAWRKMRALKSGEYDASRDFPLSFYDADNTLRAAFNDGAGSDVLRPLPPRTGARVVRVNA